MKILVTGAKGQVGSALCRLGKRTSFEIIGLSSQDLDICNEAAIEAAMASIKPDVLVNVAAYTAVDKAEQERAQAYRTNAEGPGYLARVTSIADIPLLHLSTDYVFNGNKLDPYTETDPVAPLGVYGASKLAGELAIQKEHSKYLILRTSWVFGLEGQNFPKTMLRLASERPEIRVVVDQRGCPTFADDIAKAILGILRLYQENGTLPWGLYHYAGSPSCSWYEFATYIVNEAVESGRVTTPPLMVGIPASEYPTLAKRPGNSQLNCGKFLATFPRIELSNWAEGIRKILKK